MKKSIMFALCFSLLAQIGCGTESAGSDTQSRLGSTLALSPSNEVTCKPLSEFSARDTKPFNLKIAATLAEVAVANSNVKFLWIYGDKLEQSVDLSDLKVSKFGHLEKETTVGEGLLLRVRVVAHNRGDSSKATFKPYLVNVSLIPLAARDNNIVAGYASSFTCGNIIQISDSTEETAVETVTSDIADMSDKEQLINKETQSNAPDAMTWTTGDIVEKTASLENQDSRCSAQVLDPCWKLTSHSQNEAIFKPQDAACESRKPDFLIKRQDGSYTFKYSIRAI